MVIWKKNTDFVIDKKRMFFGREEGTVVEEEGGNETYVWGGCDGGEGGVGLGKEKCEGESGCVDDFLMHLYVKLNELLLKQDIKRSNMHL